MATLSRPQDRRLPGDGAGRSRSAVATVSNPVLEHFGFSSVESYTAWLDTLNQTQMDAHLGELIEFVRPSE